ncbi:hypothetical protein [Mycobacterium avium]|uniref:hypothetical protein n=1 Tax=Mycobacterium avium TaxID=1764 RepID=UPI001CC39590|nr:hypothetical protein [Mycobacterium avium]MBZ4521842.1 hypothetical protein [Mycobacterium avium subsp. hominissuis]MBZ4531146.1 hypothetical protein [Mycobacterium avium subsp. hominissuis]
MTDITDEKRSGKRDHDERPALRTYFVNGERLRTTEERLTVREILKDAGFTPVKDYRLSRDSDHRVFEHHGAEVPIRDGEKFTATFVGPTPTS